MKRIICVLCLLCCGVARAEQINLRWLNYDGTIYQNSTCEIDGDLNLPITPPTRYGYTFTGWELLPFTRLEYIENTEEQYINTGLTVDYGDIAVTAVFMPVSWAYDHEYSCIFGVNKHFQAGYNIGGTANIGNASSARKFFALDKKVVINAVLSPNIPQTYYVDNVSTGLSRSFGYAETLILFDSTYVNSYPARGRLYSFSAFRDDEIIMDLIPVLDKEGVPCMYDKIENKYYYNQGTGQFIAGPVLND